MPVNRQTVRELSRTTLYNITSSGQAWRAFLDAAARLYKYSFPEQVLIYAQEPEATACAAKEVWYTRMKRSLRPDAQAIALPDPHSHFGRLKYVFDVRETQPLPGAPEFRQWSLPFEALERVTDRLGQEYGISREPVVADRVYALVMNAPRELYPMKLTAMLRAADAEGRWSGQDDAALARQFHQLVADSAAYMVGVRVGIGTGAVTSDALESITRFNSSGLAALAGTYASRLAASVLRDVERAARENDRLAFPARGVQNEGREEFSHAAEAAKEVQDNDIYNTERSALPGSDAGGTGDSTGQIRPAAPQISGEKRPRSAEHPAAGGHAEQPSGTDRPSGARAGGADDGASGTAHEAAGQTDGPAWLGRDDEQPAPAGGGNGDGTDLRQLSLFPAEEEIQETGRSGTERPVSLSPDEIDDILRCDREYKKGCKKQDIESFFSTTMDMQERKAFLADAMGHIYTELFIGNHRYGYCNRGNGTVEFWRGGYLSARAKTTLTLLEVAERAAQLIEQGTYRREAPPAAFPIVEDAREEQADGTEAPKTARAGFSEAEINAVLCHGSGFSKGKFRIAEWYGGKHTEKETADFLKHEYGVGGMTWKFLDGTHGSVDYNMYGRPGISVIHGTGMDAPYQLLKWPEAARRIGRLVKDGLYLTDEEEQQYPEWKREKQAQKLKAVRRDAAREPPTPQRPCAVDDTVYLEDGKAFRIVEISGDGVRLEDADFPLLMRKESMEAFAALLRADTRNAQLLLPGPAGGQAVYTEAPRDLSLPFSGDRYLDLKDQYNRYALGCGNDAYFLFYDEDARVVSGALHTKVLHAHVPPLGEVDVTGFLKEQWPAYLKKLLCAGVDTALFEPGAGQPEPVRLCRAAEALPRGGIIEIEGREHSITEVNFKSRTVILKDMEPAPGQPRYTTMDVSSAYDAFQEDGRRMAELPQAAQVQKDTLPVPKLDYRYPTENASPGGPKARFALNAAAIGTLRRIEDEGRMATAEEQGILARYVGWGGLADAFDREKTEWAQEYAQLKSLLDESEYMAARASTLTAFYTPPTVIRAMYGALERWGVTGGNILEPSMGVGAFFGCRPEQFDTNPTGLYGVELDHISARIAGQLYQSAHIYACGYEKTALPDSFFDCAVGNVPFGSFGVHDTRYDREHWLIHDYFFGKTIDKVRTGGIIAFITSSGTLDKASGNVRRYIAQRCELIGAVRLPSDTFRQSAGTEVTSDILFLQKRERMADRDEPWLHVGKTGDGVPINQYFAEHPEMVLGDMVMESGPFGPRSVCRPRPGQDLGAALHAALEGLDARLPAALPLEQAEQEIEMLPADPDVRNYSFTEVDGRLYFRENSVMRAVKLDGANTRRVRELIALRGQTRRLMQVQLDGCGDAAVQLEQDRLNRLYDNFVRRYGRINSRGNAGVFRDDSGYFLLCALEVFDDEGNFKCKSDMFTKRTIQARRPATEVGTASEALAVSISERACVDLPYMAQLLRTEDQDGIVRALQGAIFRDPSRVREGIPESGWVTADEYLSGNVREKLHTAQKAAEADAAYVVNVSALEQVQPAPVEAGDIEVHLGATWIPVDVVKDFMVELKIRDKSKAIIGQLRQTYNQSMEYRLIQKYNSYLIGVHNYYSIATHVNIDIHEIAFDVKKSLYNRLKHRLQKKGKITNRYIKEKYGTSREVRYLNGHAVVPIAYVQHRVPMDKKNKVNKYTPEGRAEIHKNLAGINMDVLYHLMNSPAGKQSVEYNDNRIALYVAQKGKCAVSGVELEANQVDCHHKKPLSLGGDDSYKNLIIVSDVVHILVHSSNDRTIRKYLEVFKPNKKQLEKLNKLPVPEVERKNVVVKPTDIQREMVAELGERAEAVRNGNVDPSEDNMLKITNDGRKLALDQRLIDPLLPDEAGSKVNASVEEVFRLWQEFASTKGTQLVFCDLSTPKAEKKIKCMTDGVAAVQAAAFSVYADVRDKLIGHGVPPGEIAFIHDADNEKKKAELFAKVRSGKVRILLGSTQKMGAGTNVQTLLAAEHHLDVPWRPSDIEQREGRAIRQGNTNKKVFIHRYVTEGTFDSYSWQLIETKQRFISQVMSGKAPSRSCEDLDEAVLSYGEIKALSTGNPHILEKVQLETDVTKLRLLKSSHVSQRYRLEDMLLLEYPQQLLERRQKIGAIEKDIPRRDANTPEDREQFSMTVMGREYTDKAAAGAELLALCQTVVQRGEAMEIGSYRGFAMRLEYRAMEQAFVVGLRGAAVYFAELGTDVQGNLARLNNALNGMEAHLKKLTQEISEIEKQQENTRQELEKPFAQEQELAEKEARLSAVNALLNIDGKNSIPDLMDDTLDIEPPQRAAKDYER